MLVFVIKDIQYKKITGSWQAKPYSYKINVKIHFLKMSIVLVAKKTSAGTKTDVYCDITFIDEKEIQKLNYLISNKDFSGKL